MLNKDNANFVVPMYCRNIVYEKSLLPLPDSTRKIAALLMLYPTETLDLLPPDAQIDAHLKHQKGIFRPRAVKKRENKNSRKWLV